MKYYIIAGEASGDLHGSNLMRALQKEDEEAEFRVWGGDRMQRAGGALVRHYRDLAFMGFTEVLLNLRTILRNIRFCKEDILNFQPDVLILIDYPGFNLRIARWAQEEAIKVFYYISPQLWAWHSSRVHGIKKWVDRMFVILPFEASFYAKYDYAVDFVGHPLLDLIDDYPVDESFFARNGLSNRPIIALLPGSRRQEITRMLAVMLQVLPEFPDYQFVVAGAPSIPAGFYRKEMERLTPIDTERVGLVQNETYQLLTHAKAALVTSGTATLEAGLFGAPQVVCYRGGWLSYQIARRLVNVQYISLVNLVVDRPLLRELIQSDLRADRLAAALGEILDPEKAREIKAGYEELRSKLGYRGASRRTAERMVAYLHAERET